MIIKNRIRNIWPYLNLFSKGQEIFFSVPISEVDFNRLIEIGFTSELSPGEQILPKSIKSISKFNAEGKYIKRKDLPKETVYRQSEWTWKDWGGYEYSKIVDIPYERYQREFIPPPSEELTIFENNNEKIILSRGIIISKENEKIIKHLINLFLELFGKCEILTSELLPPFKPQIKKLNWDILPPGEYPWNRVKNKVKEIIKRQPKGNQPVIRFRIETISNYKPDFIAIGKGGFNNYLVFGFKNKNLYLLESVREGNATYVFRNEWEDLSKLTKKEILTNDLQEDRIIHREGWDTKIKKLLK